KNKKSATSNDAGRALGMAVFILIALWVWDLLSLGKYHKNHGDTGQGVQTQTCNGKEGSGVAVPFPLAEELRTNYGDQFKYVVMASWEGERVLSYGDKNLSQNGIYIDTDGPAMLTLNILKGSIYGLNDPNSIMLS